MNKADLVQDYAYLLQSETLERALVFAFALVLVVGGLALAHKRLRVYFAARPHREFHRQLIMLGLTLLGILILIVTLPVDNEMRAEVLGIFGIILSATIALSSTSLIGNAMAGLMIRAIKNVRPGDYIHIGEHSGRVSEMDLLHIEIQTETRDLTTLPNLYLVTQPVRVLRRTGTILAVEVSLGYDVPRHTIERVLLDAAQKAGLQKPALQIRALGDFSVTYAIVGLLTDTYHLLSKRRELHARTLDALHGAGIEIASPNLLNIRDYPATKAYVPEQVEPSTDAPAGLESADALIFDKALQAQTIARMRERVETNKAALQELDEQLKGEMTQTDRERAEAEKTRLSELNERLEKAATEGEQRIERD